MLVKRLRFDAMKLLQLARVASRAGVTAYELGGAAWNIRLPRGETGRIIDIGPAPAESPR
jgi:hypothetical protein